MGQTAYSLALESNPLLAAKLRPSDREVMRWLTLPLTPKTETTWCTEGLRVTPGSNPSSPTYTSVEHYTDTLTSLGSFHITTVVIILLRLL